MMDDSIGTEPLTLTSWEKYHEQEDIWTEAASLNIPRAYPGIWKYKQFVYVFGGLHNFNPQDSFERYDSYLDAWENISLRYFKLYLILIDFLSK